jgi:small subunit ribosomal protein S4
MARYTGPKTRIARKWRSNIRDDKVSEKKLPTTTMAKKEKKSEYAIQLMEKQKAKYSYGILEKQFRGLFKSISY